MTDQSANEQKGKLATLAIFIGVPAFLIAGFVVAWMWAKVVGLIGFGLLLWAAGAIFVKVVEGNEAKGRRRESVARLTKEVGRVPKPCIDVDGRIFAKSPDGKAFLWASGSILYTIPLKEVIEADVRVDSDSVSQVNKGSLAAGLVGGFVLLGGVGAVAGAVAAGRTERKKVSSITIQLITKNAGSLTLPFYRGVPLETSDPTIRSALKEAEHWRGEFIRAIKD